MLYHCQKCGTLLHTLDGHCHPSFVDTAQETVGGKIVAFIGGILMAGFGAWVLLKIAGSSGRLEMEDFVHIASQNSLGMLLLCLVGLVAVAVVLSPAFGLVILTALALHAAQRWRARRRSETRSNGGTDKGTSKIIR